MQEYFAFDTSIPRDTSGVWNEEKKAASLARNNSFRDYFNKLATDNSVADKVVLGHPMVGFAPPMLQVFTDASTAATLAKSSGGRVFMSKPELH
jgi:hypothetical protein